MTCCGNVVEVTDEEDIVPVYLCQQCGKQGTASIFPDESTNRDTESVVDRVRWKIAESFAGLAARIAPK